MIDDRALRSPVSSLPSPSLRKLTSRAWSLHPGYTCDYVSASAIIPGTFCGNR